MIAVCQVQHVVADFAGHLAIPQSHTARKLGFSLWKEFKFVKVQYVIFRSSVARACVTGLPIVVIKPRYT